MSGFWWGVLAAAIGFKLVIFAVAVFVEPSLKEVCTARGGELIEHKGQYKCANVEVLK